MSGKDGFSDEDLFGKQTGITIKPKESAGFSDEDLFKSPSEGKTEDNSLWSPITGIPNAIGEEAAKGWGQMFPEESRSDQGPIAGPMQTLGRAGGALRTLASPFTGTAQSLIGRPMAWAEHGIGTLINPEVAAHDNPEAMYETAKEDVGKAMGAMRPAGAPIPSFSGRFPSGFHGTKWQPGKNWGVGPAPVRPSVTVPPPETIGDFDVPLTVGQAAGDTTALTEEQAALRGARGEKSQKLAEQRLTEQQDALEAARSGIGRSFDRFGQEIVPGSYESGEMISAQVAERAAAAKARADQLYEKVRTTPGEFRRDTFEGIADRIKNDLDLGTNPPVRIDRLKTSTAADALDYIEENINRLKIENRATTQGVPNPAETNPDKGILSGITLEGVDETRKGLVQFTKDAKKWPPDADTRATQAVLHAFDRQIERAVEEGLFSGDPRVLQWLKDARAAHSEYRKLYTPLSRDGDVARAMRHILGNGIEAQKATPEEIANYLYGTANIGKSGLSARLTHHLKGIFGEQSPEWDAVRQGLWSRLTESGGVGEGPQKAFTRLDKFLNGSGRALAEKAFTPAERQLMQRYADLQRKLIPPQKTIQNWNLPMFQRISENARAHIGSLIGSHIGGLFGALAGNLAGRGITVVDRALNARRIAQMMPTIDQSLDRWQKAQAALNNTLPSKKALTIATERLINSLTSMGIDSGAVMRALQGTMPSHADEEQNQP
jgi:hypothetical protein